MKLKTYIFLWASLATVLPLTGLVLLTTYISERAYHSEVSREVNTGLNTLVAEIDRRLQSEREMILGLAAAPATHQYLPILRVAAQGRLHPDYAMRTQRLNAFLEDFQGVLPGLYTLRVLDRAGNTLVMVRNAKRSGAVYDSLDGIPLAEQEVADEAFVASLDNLRPHELGYVVLPQRREESPLAAELSMLDYVVPLGGDTPVGYLAVNVQGQEIDRILDLAPRPYKGRLLVAEVNPDHPARHGQLLYDDVRQMRFAQPSQVRQGGLDSDLLQAVERQPFGFIGDENSLVYFVEYFPYPNLLVSWVVATRIDAAVLGAPFNRIRTGIWLFAAVALALSLVLASIGARKIARPVSQLTHNLKAYAHGQRRLRLRDRGIQETDELQAAFNYMAETLERAREERNEAQAMMLRNAKLASLGQMAAGIGHELNNPLNNILSLSKLVERRLIKDPAAHQDLLSLREEAVRASQIVSGVLNFARQVPPRCERFALRPWLAETVALVEREARNRGVAIRWEGPDECRLEGDRAQLQQALINLLLNAIQANGSGAQVTVRAEVDGDWLHLAVEDEGSGIPEEALASIFDPFFTTKGVGEGTGLGLSIALGVVEHHGGQLSVANRPDGGVRALIRVPLSGCGRPLAERAEALTQPFGRASIPT